MITNTLTYHILNEEMLAAACMPFIIRGGLFIKTSEVFTLGTHVTVTLMLLDELEPLDFNATVIWLTPGHESDQMPQGLGVQFSEEDSKRVRSRLESIVSGAFTLNATNMEFFD